MATMTDEEAEEAPQKFVDSPQAPDIFADQASGLFLVSGNVRITLTSWRVEHSATPGPRSQVVIGRLVMPVRQAKMLVEELGAFLERARKAESLTGAAQNTLQ